MRRWAGLVLCAEVFGCGGDRLIVDTPIKVDVLPTVEVSQPALLGWAVVNERSRIALTTAGPALDGLSVWLQMYAHRVAVLEVQSDRVRVVVTDGHVQLEVFVPMEDLWRVTSRQTHLYDLAEGGVTFGFLTAGTEVTVMENGTAAFEHISVEVDDITVEGHVRASDVARIYQPALVHVEGFTTVDFQGVSTRGTLVSGTPIHADINRTHSVESLVHIGRVNVALFEEDLVTLVAPSDVESFPRLVLELRTSKAHICAHYSHSTQGDDCFVPDPWPTLRNEPLGNGAQPFRCVSSRMPTRDERRWVAPPGTCLWHESIRAPVGMILEPTTIRPAQTGRASLVDTPFAANGFFVRTK